MKKQKLTLALALMLVLLSLTACGGKDAGADAGAGSSTNASVSTPAGKDEDQAAGSAQDGADLPAMPGGSTSAADEQGETDPAENSQPAQTEKPAEQPSSKPDSKPSAPAQDEKPAAPEQPTAKQPTMSELVSAVEDAMGELPSFMELTADELKDVYGLDSSSVAEFTCKMPMMNTQATEFFIAKAVSGQAETVKKGALKRQADMDETWKRYLPAQYELVQNYKLVVNGDYVLYVVGEKAAAAVDAFNSLTK